MVKSCWIASCAWLGKPNVWRLSGFVAAPPFSIFFLPKPSVLANVPFWNPFWCKLGWCEKPALQGDCWWPRRTSAIRPWLSCWSTTNVRAFSVTWTFWGFWTWTFSVGWMIKWSIKINQPFGQKKRVSKINGPSTSKFSNGFGVCCEPSWPGFMFEHSVDGDVGGPPPCLRVSLMLGQEVREKHEETRGKKWVCERVVNVSQTPCPQN